jgi:hypothetical protein
MVSDDPFLPGEAGTDPDKIFPSLRIREFVALVGLSTAKPCGLFLAVGSVGELQLRELERILAETGQRKMFRVLLIHHPPLPGTVSWRKRLTDDESLRSILARQGVELVLHGHAHRGSQGRVDTLAGEAPTFGVTSASALGRTAKRRARYHIYRLEKNPLGWQMAVSVRCFFPPSETFIEESESHVVLPRPVV